MVVADRHDVAIADCGDVGLCAGFLVSDDLADSEVCFHGLKITQRSDLYKNYFHLFRVTIRRANIALEATAVIAVIAIHAPSPLCLSLRR